MSSNQDTTARAFELISRSDIPITMKALKAEGISTWTVRNLVQSGKIETPARGIYRLPAEDMDIHSDWALVSLKYPSAVICLLSAASYHGMTQELPHTLSVAVPRSMGHVPAMGPNYPLEIDTLIWRRDEMFDIGVEQRLIDGVSMKITSPERTLVDLFRYSTFNPSMKDASVRITDEMFLECLDRCNGDHFDHFSFDTVAAIARVLRCYEALRPYTKTVRYVRSEIPSL